jgi:hypothetical protein
MLAIHAPALLRAAWAVGAGQADAQAVQGVLWLGLWSGFFLLKLCDPPWLRFRTDKRSLVAVAMALVLMHANPLGLRPDGTPNDQLPAATMLLVIGLERVQQGARTLAASWAAAVLVPDTPLAPSLGIVCARPHAALFHTVIRPRSPPCHSPS